MDVIFKKGLCLGKYIYIYKAVWCAQYENNLPLRRQLKA